jgi:hypothetical protein
LSQKASPSFVWVIRDLFNETESATPPSSVSLTKRASVN